MAQVKNEQIRLQEEKGRFRYQYRLRRGLREEGKQLKDGHGIVQAKLLYEGHYSNGIDRDYKRLIKNRLYLEVYDTWGYAAHFAPWWGSNPEELDF